MYPLTNSTIKAAVAVAVIAAAVPVGASWADDAPRTAVAAPAQVERSATSTTVAARPTPPVTMPAAAPALSFGMLQTMRAATKQFRDVDVAIAAGYQPTEVCVALPDGSAAMGYHYFNMDNVMDGVNDPTKPDILLYTHDEAGNLHLAGLEFFQPDADQDLTTDDDRPSFDGHPFDGPMEGHEPGMPVHYDLHIWLYEHNPAGMLAGFNPSVSCDAPHGGHG
jgi:hypothetical protein